MQKVNYRYSDSDFIAYLLSLGYEYQEIEITRDKGGRFKAFAYFHEDKEALLSQFETFRNGEAIIDPLQYSINRKKINKIIKSEILKFQVEQLD
jgi:hypothetical protein